MSIIWNGACELNTLWLSLLSYYLQPVWKVTVCGSETWGITRQRLLPSAVFCCKGPRCVAPPSGDCEVSKLWTQTDSRSYLYSTSGCWIQGSSKVYTVSLLTCSPPVVLFHMQYLCDSGSGSAFLHFQSCWNWWQCARRVDLHILNHFDRS